MAIGVQSFPELYTTMIGWDLYDKCWNLLTETRLAYIPFIWIILENLGVSHISNGLEGSLGSLRRMELSLIGTLFIILIVVVPCIKMDLRTVAYHPTCETKANYYPADTGTTYDEAFTIPQDEIRVPLFWYAVLSLSEGLTSGANELIGCVPNLRKMVVDADYSRIQDQNLIAELKEFQEICFVPSKALYLKDTRDNNQKNLSIINEKINSYGIEDTEWMGSRAFNQVYYTNFKSNRPIPGFPYDSTKDINNKENAQNHPAYDSPYCSDWWNDSQHGLRIRVFNTLPKNFALDYRTYLTNEQTQDALIKRILSSNSGYQSANDMMSQYGYSSVISKLGIISHEFKEYPKIYAATQAAPIIQSLILLLVYVFLPFALVFSGYSIKGIFAAALLICSLIFWSFIWKLVGWIDKTLMTALYSGWFDKQSPSASLVDMISGTLIVVAPLLWFVFIGFVGKVMILPLGNVTSSLSNIADNAAQSGSQLQGDATQTAVKVATLI